MLCSHSSVVVWGGTYADYLDACFPTSQEKRKRGKRELVSFYFHLMEIRLVLLREEVLHVPLDALLGQIAHGVGSLGSQVPCE